MKEAIRRSTEDCLFPTQHNNKHPGGASFTVRSTPPCTTASSHDDLRKKHSKYARDGLRQLLNVLGLVVVHMVEEPILVEVVHGWMTLEGRTTEPSGFAVGERGFDDVEFEVRRVKEEIC